MSGLDWETLERELAARNEQREECIAVCRKIIQMSSRSIKCVQRGDIAAAEANKGMAMDLLLQVRIESVRHPWLVFTGPYGDAEKEAVEACAVLAFAKEEPLPSHTALGVSISSYLNGVVEAASELRRLILDHLRNENLREAVRLCQQMEAVYDAASALDYPDAITGGLRRSNDNLRAVLERTRSDLTMTALQIEHMKLLRLQTQTG